MKTRKKLSRRGSRRLFKATSRVKPVNAIKPLRGGFRL